MKDFDWIYQHVLQRLGDARELESFLTLPNTAAELTAKEDSYYLSTMSRRIFRAGLKHSLVDAKWSAFEKAFFQFNPARVAMMSEEELEGLMANRGIIRHWNKLKSVPANAALLLEVIEQHGSVGQWLADWPVDNIVGLWTLLKKQGTQLGGNSGAYFLRMVGKDSFILTEDIVVALKALGIVDKRPGSQKDLQAVQQAFNQWQQQSGRPLCQISRLLSMTVNY
jgi:3-methyladenine DNA glycosylase Tag